MDILNQILSTTFLLIFIRSVVPLLLTALGGLFSERSGVVNIALDGLIIFGALSGAVVTLATEEQLGSFAPWLGWLAGAAVGGLVAWIHAVLSIKYRANQVISGTAINLLAAGMPPVILQAFYATSTESPKVQHALPAVGHRGLQVLPARLLRVSGGGADVVRALPHPLRSAAAGHRGAARRGGQHGGQRPAHAVLGGHSLGASWRGRRACFSASATSAPSPAT